MISVKFLPPSPGVATERSTAMTQLGRIAVEAYPDGTVAALTLDARPKDGDTERFVPLIGQIVDALADRTATTTFQIAPVAEGLQLEVLQAIATIPPLTLSSYKQIARRAGRPKAVRAVASAVGRNPVPLLVQCHRVVPAECGRNLVKALSEPSRLGSFTPSAELKMKILAAEGYFDDKNLPNIKFLS